MACFICDKRVRSVYWVVEATVRVLGDEDLIEPEVIWLQPLAPLEWVHHAGLILVEGGLVCIVVGEPNILITHFVRVISLLVIRYFKQIGRLVFVVAL